MHNSRFTFDESEAIIHQSIKWWLWYHSIDEIIYIVSWIIKSEIYGFLFETIGTQITRWVFCCEYQYIEQLPIRTINFSDPAEVQQHARMVALVERMLSLQRELAAAQTPAEKTRLQRQVDATDAQIDALVYALYGLTEEEVGVVEGR